MIVNFFFNKNYFSLFSLIFLLASCSDGGQKESGQAENPNIIFILADDMGIGDIKAYNEKSKIPTPNINKLAQQGMQFNDMHSAGSWCVPSRYGFLTGQYPMRTEMNWRNRNIIGDSQVTIGAMLKEHGYQTGMVGKWHQGFDIQSSWNEFDFSNPIPGGPLDNGFDYYFGIPASLDIPPYFYIENKKAVAAPTESVEASHTEGATSSVSGAFWRAGKMAPGFKHEEVLPKIREHGLRYIDSRVEENPDKPFFLYIALSAPHTPWLPTEAFKGKSGAGLYGDFTMQVDDLVGSVMQKLKDKGIAENTILIFTSDNGPLWFEEDKEKFDHLSQNIYRGMKGDHWEGGHRVPMIARWPGKIEPGSQSSTMVNFTDFKDTFHDLVEKADNQNTPDGYSFLPVLMGDHQVTDRNTMMVGSKMVRKGNWKLIFGSGMGGIHQNYGNIPSRPDTAGSLYNLEEDIREQNNLYQKNPEKVEELKQVKSNIQNQN